MIDGVRCVIGVETFFCASISTEGSVGPRSAGLACGALGSEGACFSGTGVTTRGRTALLLSCAFISTAAKRTATTNRARRVGVFIMFYLRKSYRIKADASRGDNVALDSRRRYRVVNLFLLQITQTCRHDLRNLWLKCILSGSKLDRERLLCLFTHPFALLSFCVYWQAYRSR